jgi:hypothetical protein
MRRTRRPVSGLATVSLLLFIRPKADQWSRHDEGGFNPAELLEGFGELFLMFLELLGTL